jgi:hypothetical protein
MRVLVCGGRDFTDLGRVWSMLDTYHNMPGAGGPITLVIHGAAKGADELAAEWARSNRVEQRAFHADWQTHGKAAGPIRNRAMLDEGKPNLVIAFPGGKGTANMVMQAAGIVEVVQA